MAKPAHDAREGAHAGGVVHGSTSDAVELVEKKAWGSCTVVFGGEAVGADET